MKIIHKLGIMAITGVSILFATTIPAAAEDLRTQIQEQKSEVSDIRAEMKSLQNEISALNDEMKENQDKLNTTTAEIKELQATIEGKEATIVSLEESIEKRIEVLKERAAALQQQDRTNIVFNVIFNSENIADLLQNMTSLGAIFQSDTDIMQQLADDQVQLEAEKEALSEKEAALEKKQLDLEAQQATLKEKEAMKDNALTSLKNKLATAMTNLEATEDQLAAQEAAALFIADQSADEDSTTTTNTTNTTSASLLPTTESSDTASTTETPSSSSNSGSVVSIGLSYQGVPYVFGGKSPSGFDCSGFIWYVFNQSGRNIGYQTAASLYSSSAKVSSPSVGDLVFFSNTYKPGISHVGIYIGNNQFVHAGGSAVQVTSLSNPYWSAHFTGYGSL